MISPNAIQELSVGETTQISAKIRPRGNADDGLQSLIFLTNSTIDSDQLSVSEATLVIEVSKSRNSNSGGLLGRLSPSDCQLGHLRSYSSSFFRVSQLWG